jgi:hypothetical protein
MTVHVLMINSSRFSIIQIEDQLETTAESERGRGVGYNEFAFFRKLRTQTL